MIKGVRYGYRYKLKAVYAHFPINMTFDGEDAVSVRNFLGEKVVRNIKMLEGVRVVNSEEKDEIYVEVRNVAKRKGGRGVAPGAVCMTCCTSLTHTWLSPSSQGNDIEKVSLSAALIHQSALVTKKDVRKFLDGASRAPARRSALHRLRVVCAAAHPAAHPALAPRRCQQVCTCLTRALSRSPSRSTMIKFSHAALDSGVECGRIGGVEAFPIKNQWKHARAPAVWAVCVCAGTGSVCVCGDWKLCEGTELCVQKLS